MKENIGNRKLTPFTGMVTYVHPSDRSMQDARKRCVIWAYSEKHAEEMTYMFLPPMRDTERFKGFVPGCNSYEVRLGDYPGVYVLVPQLGRLHYERLTHFYIRPQPFSKNTQRKIGITVGVAYRGNDETRVVETLTGQPEQLEALGLFENGNELTVYYKVGESREKCTVREFNKWKDHHHAEVGEVHLRRLANIRRSEKALLDAACEVLANAKGTEGVGDAVNGVRVGEVRAGYEKNGGRDDGLRGALGSLRHMSLILFEEMPPGGQRVSDDFDFWLNGKGWCHWSAWNDDLLRQPKVARAAASWEDGDLNYVHPDLRGLVRAMVKT